jgi:hypothetical protein
MSKEQTFRSERNLSLRQIRLRRKWVSASGSGKIYPQGVTPECFNRGSSFRSRLDSR